MKRSLLALALLGLFATPLWAPPPTNSAVEVVSAAPSGSCTSNVVKLVKKSGPEGGDLYACLGSVWTRLPVSVAEISASNTASGGACLAIDQTDTTKFEWVSCGGAASVSNAPYSFVWDGVTTVAPSQNAVFNEMETRQDADEDLSDIAALSCSTNGFVLTWDAATQDWICAAATGGVSDGNKGDVVVTGSGSVWTLDTDSVGIVAFDAPTLENEMEGVIDLNDIQNKDIDFLTGQTNINTAFIFSGADVNFETGASNAYPLLLNSTAPNGGDCDASNEYGRLAFDSDDDTNGTVVVCTSTGWKDIDDDGGAGGFTSFDASGETGVNQTITNGNTLAFTTGTSTAGGIDTVGVAGDIIRLDIDLTEIAGNGVLGGTMDAPTLDDNTVTSTKIVDATIAQVDIDDTQTIAADPANGTNSVWFGTTGLIFEGTASDTNELLLTAGALAGDVTLTLPSTTGTLVGTGDTATVTSLMIVDGTIVAGDIATDAVTSTKILDNTVDSADILQNTITAADLTNSLDLGAETSLEIPNSSSPDAAMTSFATIAGDDNTWIAFAAGRGTAKFNDGTSITNLVGVLASDTPTNAQVPTFNTASGTITWENGSGGTVSAVGDCTVPGACFTSAGTGSTLTANGDFIIDIDDDASTTTADTFQIRNSANTVVAEVDETGLLTLAQQATAGAVDFLEGSGSGTDALTIEAPASITTSGTCTLLNASTRFIPNSCLELIDVTDTNLSATSPVSLSGNALGIVADSISAAHLTNSLDLGGETSLEIPNGPTPSVTVFGQIAGDSDAWGSITRGAPVFFDGTATTRLVNVLASDTPTDGQVPRFNDATDTITWETGVGGATLLDDLTDVTITAAAANDALVYSGSAWVDTPMLISNQVSPTTGQLLVYDGVDSYDNGTAVTASITNDAITYAKIQNVSAISKLLGRGAAAGAGDVEEITLGAGLTMTATTLSTTGAATAWDAITDPAASADIAFADTAQTLTWDTPATATAHDDLAIIHNHDAGTDATTQRALSVTRGATSGTATLEALVQVNNNDTDGAVTKAVEVTSAAGAITTALDVSDSDIVTALAIGANDITTASVTLSQVEIDVLDGGTTIAELVAGGASSDLAGKLSDETGTGLAVFGTSPTIATPALTLVNNTAPTTVTEAVIEWETDDDHIIVGGGASASGNVVEFIPAEDVSGDIGMDDGGVVAITNIPAGLIVPSDINKDAQAWDFQGTGDGSLELPNGGAPTVNAAGEIAEDTTANQLVYGAAPKVLDPRNPLSVTIINPAATDDPLLLQAPYGMVITKISCLIAGATNDVIRVQECNTSGASCTDIDSADLTCTTTINNDTTIATDDTIAAANFLKLNIVSQSGSPTNLVVTILYTIVRE